MRFCFLTVFLVYFVSLSYGKDENTKNKMAEAIIRKLYNITSNAFSRGTAEQKEKAWHVLENKLKDVSMKRYGKDAGKYIDLIMRGIRSMSATQSESRPQAEPPVASTAVQKQDESLDTNPSETRKATHVKDEHVHNTAHLSAKDENKKAFVQKIAYKLDSFANDFLKNSSFNQPIKENIKNKIMDLIIKKHKEVVQSDPQVIKALSERLAEEIGTVVDKVLANFSRKAENETKSVPPPPIVMRSAKYLVHSTPPPVNDDFKGVTSTVNCDALTDKVCSALKYANKIICPLDGRRISVDRLCDGKNDCVDRYDERDCIRQAIDKIKDTRRLIADVEETVIKNCASTHLDNSLLSKQSIILGSVLESELNFLRNHAEGKEKEREFNEFVVKKMVNEVALVLSALSIGLEGSLCPRYYGQDAEHIVDHKNSMYSIDKNDPFEDIKLLPTTKSTAPNKCMCHNGFCSDINCSHMCRLICWQKHSLSHFGCQAVDGGNAISLSYLCDGKSDCYDQSDEEDCATGGISRFEAIGIYDDVLTDLSLQAQANEMQYIRNNLLSLRASVSYLQKVTTQAKPPPEHVRTVRDLCFSSLVSTYDKVLSKGNIQNLDEIHHYLLSLNQKLIAALKRSHAGNDKMMTFDGCYCQKNHCLNTRCSKRCERACAVEAQFTKFSCDGTANSSMFVPSNAICNGNVNCPKGEDEEGCKKESCRAYHLVLVRHFLSKVGEKEKGTSLGDLLKTWKTKATTSLLVAEGNGRPTQPMVREVLDSLNRDIVVTYAAMSNNKLDAKVHKIFFELSQQVLRALKSCQ